MLYDAACATYNLYLSTGHSLMHISLPLRIRHLLVLPNKSGSLLACSSSLCRLLYSAAPLGLFSTFPFTAYSHSGQNDSLSVEFLRCSNHRFGMWIILAVMLIGVGYATYLSYPLKNGISMTCLSLISRLSEVYCICFVDADSTDGNYLFSLLSRPVCSHLVQL